AVVNCPMTVAGANVEIATGQPSGDAAQNNGQPVHVGAVEQRRQFPGVGPALLELLPAAGRLLAVRWYNGPTASVVVANRVHSALAFRPAEGSHARDPLSLPRSGSSDPPGLFCCCC